MRRQLPHPQTHTIVRSHTHTLLHAFRKTNGRHTKGREWKEYFIRSDTTESSQHTAQSHILFTNMVAGRCARCDTLRFFSLLLILFSCTLTEANTHERPKHIASYVSCHIHSHTRSRSHTTQHGHTHTHTRTSITLVNVSSDVTLPRCILFFSLDAPLPLCCCWSRTRPPPRHHRCHFGEKKLRVDTHINPTANTQRTNFMFFFPFIFRFFSPFVRWFVMWRNMSHVACAPLKMWHEWIWHRTRCCVARGMACAGIEALQRRIEISVDLVNWQQSVHTVGENSLYTRSSSVSRKFLRFSIAFSSQFIAEVSVERHSIICREYCIWSLHFRHRLDLSTSIVVWLTCVRNPIDVATYLSHAE